MKQIIPHMISLATKIKIAFLLFAIASFPFIIRAHTGGKAGKSNPKLWFEENKNQWPDQVLYKRHNYIGYMIVIKVG